MPRHGVPEGTSRTGRALRRADRTRCPARTRAPTNQPSGHDRTDRDEPDRVSRGPRFQGCCPGERGFSATEEVPRGAARARCHRNPCSEVPSCHAMGMERPSAAVRRGRENGLSCGARTPGSGFRCTFSARGQPQESRIVALLGRPEEPAGRRGVVMVMTRPHVRPLYPVRGVIHDLRCDRPVLGS